MEHGQGQEAPDFDIDSALSDYVDSLDGEQPEDDEADQADTESDETESPDAEGADESDESPDEDTDEAEDDAEPELLEVEFEGKQYKVPPELKDALLMRKDYTTKTQEVAEQRKALEAERTQFHQSAALQQQMIGDYAQLTNLDNQINAYQNVDWFQLINESPEEAQKHQVYLTQLQNQRNQLAQQIQNKKAHVQQMTLAQQQELVQKGSEQLSREFKNWGPALQAELKKTGIDVLGYSQIEMDGVMDPRLVRGLYMINEYQKIIAKRADTKNKVSTAPKFAKQGAKPGNGRQTAQSKAKQDRFRRTGSMNDAASLLMDFID